MSGRKGLSEEVMTISVVAVVLIVISLVIMIIFMVELGTWSRYQDQFITDASEKINKIVSGDNGIETDEVVDDKLLSVFSWTNKNGINWMSPVRDQGSICGSCWAFAVLGAVEAVYNIESDSPGSYLYGESSIYGDSYVDGSGAGTDMSEQQLISCSEDGSCGGCYITDAYRYITESSGIVDESCYPYVGADVGCTVDGCDIVYAVGGFYDESVMADLKYSLVEDGPVAVSVEWGDIGSHSVVVVGWDDDNECIIIKNSWGCDWPQVGSFGYLEGLPPGYGCISPDSDSMFDVAQPYGVELKIV